jgi:hypothetical protein
MLGYVTQKRQTVHARHVDVADQQIDRPSCSLDHVERSRAVRCLQYLGRIAAAKDLDSDLSLKIFILKNQRVKRWHLDGRHSFNSARPGSSARTSPIRFQLFWVCNGLTIIF